MRLRGPSPSLVLRNHRKPMCAQTSMMFHFRGVYPPWVEVHGPPPHHLHLSVVLATFLLEAAPQPGPEPLVVAPGGWGCITWGCSDIGDRALVGALSTPLQRLVPQSRKGGEISYPRPAGGGQLPMAAHF